MTTDVYPLQLLLVTLAGWINRHQQQVIEYLVEENRVLKGQMKGRRLRLTDDQRRRLAAKGGRLGRRLLRRVATLVTPDTILRWHRQLIARKWTFTSKGPGRPGVTKEISTLIVRMAAENSGWGYTRIQGALKNLGHNVARSTVAKVLKTMESRPPQTGRHPGGRSCGHTGARSRGPTSSPLRCGPREGSSPTTRSSLFHACTGRQRPPPGGFSEVAVIAGARAGKDSRIAAPIVVFEAVFGGHERHLARGERGVIPLVAQDARAAKIAYGYVRDYLTRSPMLSALVDDVPASEIILTNSLAISIFPSTLRSLRGWSIPAGVLDELAFFRLEGAADSDVEIQASIRRGMVSFPRTKLVKISTPYMKSGVLYDDFRRGFGQNDPDLLVWKASSLLMNPSLTSDRLDRERRIDPSRFAREYEAEFADDLESFLPGAWVDEAVIPGHHELPPVMACGIWEPWTRAGAAPTPLPWPSSTSKGTVPSVGWSRTS
jgi:hypothetical protein